MPQSYSVLDHSLTMVKFQKAKTAGFLYVNPLKVATVCVDTAGRGTMIALDDGVQWCVEGLTSDVLAMLGANVINDPVE